MRAENGPNHGRGPALGVLCVLLACVLAAGPVGARQGAPAPEPTQHIDAPRTGDAWIDVRLADMDDYARRYPDAFVDELVRYLDAPRALVSERLAARMTAGDVYYACVVARVTGRPCRSVLETWDATRGDGWAAIAARLGVAPRSAEARRLRQAFEDSYRHWARPQPSLRDGEGGGIPSRPGS